MERGKAYFGKLAYSFTAFLHAALSTLKRGFSVFFNAVEMLIISDSTGAKIVERINPPLVKPMRPKPYLEPAPNRLCVNWYVLMLVNFLWRVYH